MRTGADLTLNPEEAARLGLRDGGRARVRSPHGEVELPVRVDPAHPAGAAFVAAACPARASSDSFPPTAAPCGSKSRPRRRAMDERFLVALIKAVVVIFVVVTAFAYTLLWERKLIGRFQARYGPNRAGPLGYLQPLADVVKLIFKEDFVPQGANKLLFQIAPMISVFAAVAAIAVIPWGDDFEVFGHTVNGVGTDLNVGVLFLFALSGSASTA